MSMSGFSALIVGLFLLTGTLDAAPYQELEHREGYVPVYIREGDTPLIDINPKLAEAFNEIDTRNLLEQSELGNKPDLILMSADSDGAMLIARPADQVMSEAEPVVIAVVPAEAVIPQLSDDAIKTINNAEQGEEPQAVINAKLAEETKEAIKDLVDVLEVEMLEKLKDAVTVEPVAIEKKSQDNKQLEVEEEKKELEEEVAEVAEVIPQQPEAPAVLAVASKDSVIEDSKLIADEKPEEQPTDVSTVEDFKTKEIDVKSIETEKIDVPEEDTPDTESTDE